MLLSILTALALAAPPQQDTTRVSAAFTSPRIPVGATTVLVVTVETRGGDTGNILLPDLPPALQILGTADYSETQVSIPGGRTRILRREITILARAPGVYRLDRVIVRTARGVFRSEPLQLVVSGTAPSGRDELAPGRSSLRAWVDPDTVYVGQQVLFQAEVTFAEDFRMRQSRPATFDPPAPSGFWIQDLPDPITIALRVRDGRTVESQTYRRAYFPLNPGRFRIPPARLHYEVRRGFLYPPESRELVSDSPAVVVLPLPEAGQPASFTGAVGRLTMTARVDPATVRVGAATVLTVEIEGVGNVKALPEPRRPVLENIDVFAPTQESVPSFADAEVRGTKRFRWMLVPEQPGVVTIPPIEYAVFDPELRTYVVLRSDSLRFEATAAVAAAPADTALRPLRGAPGADRFGWTRSPAFVAVQGLPLALLAGLLLLRRRRSLPPGPRDEARTIRARLAALHGRPADADWLADLEHVLRDAVIHVAGLPAGAPVERLRAAGNTAAADRLETLLAEVSRLRFAPGAPVDAGRLLDEAGAFLDLLVPRRGRRPAGGAAVVLLLAAVQPAGAQADPFAAGVQATAAGDHPAAVRAFRLYTQAQPADVAGWYNLGVAAAHAGDRGFAAWALLRAARLAPRDPDIRHNLQVIGGAPARAAIIPPDRLTPGERAALAAALWWMLVFGLGAVLFGRRRVGALLAVPAAAGLGVLALLLAADAVRPLQVTALGAGVSLYAAPTTREEALGRLEPGGLARIVERRDRWLLVRTPGGETGWVERERVATP